MTLRFAKIALWCLLPVSALLALGYVATERLVKASIVQTSASLLIAAKAGFTGPAALIHQGELVRSTVPGVPLAQIAPALAGCALRSQCEVQLAGRRFLAARME